MKKPVILAFITLISLALITPALADSTASSTVDGVAAAASIDSHDTINGSKIPEPKRFFASPGEINYPGQPGRFDAPPERSGYMNSLRVKDMLEFEDGGFTTEAAMKMAEGGSKRVMVRPKFGKVDKDARLPKDAIMPVVFDKAAVKDVKSLGFIVVVSDSKKSISPDVFAEAQVKAWELGGEVLYVKTEGFQRQVHTSGAGIGFTWTGTTISGGQTVSAAGVMGAGAVWGEAGYYDQPFIIINVLAAK
jgi:hypothetical protein